MQRDRIYLDHAATGFPKPPEVAAEMLRYLTEVGSNVSRGSYSSAYEAEETLFSLREGLTALFGGDDCRNTVFTSGVTAALNQLLKGLLRPGDHVLISSLEHNAVMRPLRQLAACGVRFDAMPCDEAGNLLLDRVEPMIRANTRAVVCTHASNVCGTVQPIAALGALCRRRGLLFIVDSAQTAGRFPINMREMHIDALAFAGHKTLLGAPGVGGFLIREGLAKEMEPLIAGGTGSASHLDTMPDFMPDRFEAGTPNLPGLFGLAGALRWLERHDREALLRRELQLTGRFLEGLKDIPALRIVGRNDLTDRAPVVSVTRVGGGLSELAEALDRDYGIQARVGLHCAPAAHRALGTYPEGTLRFSFGHTNTEAEVDFCLNAISECV